MRSLRCTALSRDTLAAYTFNLILFSFPFLFDLIYGIYRDQVMLFLINPMAFVKDWYIDQLYLLVCIKKLIVCDRSL